MWGAQIWRIDDGLVTGDFFTELRHRGCGGKISPDTFLTEEGPFGADSI